MDEKDKKLQDLLHEVARWRQRAMDACERACFNCEEYRPNARTPCENTDCRVYKIKEAAGK